MRNARAYWHLLFVLLMAATLTTAQTGTSRITGVVTDPSGAMVAGASVTLTNELTNANYKTVTTVAGTYLFDAIPPGSYTLQVELGGFKTFKSTRNVLTVGAPLTINAKLDVGAVTTVVEVTESYERVQTATSGNFGTIVDQRTLTDLALGLELGTGGRNPLIFVRLQPGVSVGSNTGGGSHVNGARDRAFNYTLDGIDINETSAGGSEFSPLRTNPDSLAEFRVITSNATAEYGRNSGAQVELSTRAGTNDYHGSLFYFHRNNGFGANEWEANRQGLIRPRLIQHQWGLSVGGPALRNGTYFFFNYQQQRQVQPFTRTRTVYTQMARQGIFRYRVGAANGNAGSTNPSVDASGNPLFPACGGMVTTNCINTYSIVANDPRGVGLDPTIMSQWIGLTALPSRFDVGDGLNTAGFTFSGGRLDPQRDFHVRIDHRFNDNHSLFGRYSWGRQDTVNDTVNGGEPRFPGLSPIVNTLRKPRNLALNYRMVVNPRMVNELILGGNHFTFDFIIPTAGQTLPFILNLVTDPLANDKGNLRTLTTYQLVDNFSWHRGAHAIKMGINFRYQQHIDTRGSIAGANSELLLNFSQTVNTTCATGTFPTGTAGVVSGQERFCLPGTSGTLAINSTDRGRLSSTINDLLGRIGSIRRGFVAADDLQTYQPAGSTFKNDARYGEYDFYVQDSWKWKPNFTIDVGLRLELKGHPTNPRNRIFVPDQIVRIDEAPANILRWVRGPLYDNDYNNWSPSIGFAWDPFKTGKTSVRANYRLAYDRINTFVISSQIFNTVPGLTLGVIDTAFGQNGGPGGTGGRWSDGIPTLAPPAGITPEAQAQPAAFGVGSIAVLDPDFRAPKTNMWQLDIQREVWKGIVVDVAYLGRRANGLFGAYDVNRVDIINNSFLSEFLILYNSASCIPSATVTCPQSVLLNQIYAPDTRRGNIPGTMTPETGSDFVRRLFLSSVQNGSVAGVANDAAVRVQSGVPLLTLAGLPTTFFKPFPQFSGSISVIDSNDWSTYHALQVIVTRKFTSGVQFQGSYTFSKSLDTRSFDPAFTVVARGAGQSASSSPFDPRNRRLNYARSDFDRAQILTGYVIWDLPFGPGRTFGKDSSGAWARIIEGWTIATNFVVESGRPFTVFTGFSQFTNVVNSTANCNGCPRDMGEVRLVDPAFAPGVPSYFDATERGRFSQPGPGEIGNTGRNYFTGPAFFNMDAALLKRTQIDERFKLELRLEAFNLTNSPSFAFPAAVIPPTGTTTTTLGRIGDGVLTFSRKVRIGAKLNF